ncbi:cell agglutination protein Mam3, partial [Rhodotorula kratochvilovae]
MLPRPLALPTRLALLRLAAALLVAALTLAGARASSSSDSGSTSRARTSSHFDLAAQAGTDNAWGALEGVGRAGRWLVRRQLEGIAAGEGEGGGEMGRQEFVLKLVLSVVFVLLGGVFSGLSLGLMGLDSMNLQ